MYILEKNKITITNIIKSEHFQNPFENHKKTEAIPRPNTHIHMTVHFPGFGTGNSIYSGGFKLVLWPQVSSFGEMMR